jgi:hypothetical protein
MSLDGMQEMGIATRSSPARSDACASATTSCGAVFTVVM